MGPACYSAHQAPPSSQPGIPEASLEESWIPDVVIKVHVSIAFVSNIRLYAELVECIRLIPCNIPLQPQQSTCQAWVVAPG